MLNTLHLLTSIKTPAVTGPADVRPVTPWQANPQQGFASLLQQANQERPQATAPRAAEAPRPPTASPAPAPAPENARKAKPGPAAQTPAEAPAPAGPAAEAPARPSRPARAGAADAPRDGAPPPAEDDTAQAAALPPADEESDPGAPQDVTAPTADPLWLQGMAQAAPDTAAHGTALPPGGPGQDGLPASQDALAGAGREPPRQQDEGLAGLGQDVTGEALDAAATAQAPGPIELPADATAVQHETFHEQLMTTASAAAGTASPAAARALPGAAEPGPSPLHGVQGPHLPHGPGAATPVQGSFSTTPGSTGAAAYALAAPVDSPDFPQALATQISYIVRDGVQQAQLHLNPAEMGPVSVQIALNGQQAQVDFAAASSATRAAIENSLSDLAASLQSAGFTLTGGGVSQHPQQQGQAPGQSPAEPGLVRGPAGRDEAGAPAGGTATAPRPRTAGGLDLYA